MRARLAVIAISVSISNAFGEEAYQRTASLLSTCIGEQMRLKVRPGNPIIPAEALDDHLKQKCSFLEERQEEEFIDFLRKRLLRKQTEKEQAETAIIIIGELLTSHTRGGIRRTVVEAYKSAIVNRK